MLNKSAIEIFNNGVAIRLHSVGAPEAVITAVRRSIKDAVDSFRELERAEMKKRILARYRKALKLAGAEEFLKELNKLEESEHGRNL